MKRHCAVELRPDQNYLLDARLGSVAKSFGFGSVGQFVDHAVKQLPEAKESASLIDAMTTHESYFFRDTSFWQVMEGTVLPALLERDALPVNIWCAAASTGQEPYSLAMLIEEKWAQAAGRVAILGTDVSEGSLKTASEAVYSSIEVNRGIAALRLIRHFEQVKGGFRVKPILRQRIKYERHNLMDSLVARKKCHLVLCRNVLIYFSERDKSMVLRRLVDALEPGGYLGLGTSEKCALPQIAPGWFCKPK